jgi:hypothetical protein
MNYSRVIPKEALELLRWQAPSSSGVRLPRRTWVILGIGWMLLVMTIWQVGNKLVAILVLTLGFFGYQKFKLGGLVEYRLFDQGMWIRGWFYPWEMLQRAKVKEKGEWAILEMWISPGNGKMEVLMPKEIAKKVMLVMRKYLSLE